MDDDCSSTAPVVGGPSPTATGPTVRVMSPRTAAHRDPNALTTLRGVQDEIVSRRQLLDLGITHHVVRREVAAGRWQVFGSKVVATTAEVLTRRQTCRAAVLHAGFRAHLGGSTSLEWAGLEGWYDPLIHLLVPAGTHVSPMPGVVVHRSQRMSSQDLVVTDGLRITSPARAALDGHGGCDPRTPPRASSTR